jgi:ABC-type multidrug transport system fused ATPase/permease subunit
MASKDMPVYKRPLWYWVFRGGIRLQALLLVIIVLTVGARLVPLEMQKRVVNEAISLRRPDLLVLYCGIYLAAVLASSGLKYAISVLQTLIGQRVLARMRKELFAHIITLPLSFFRRTQPGMVVSSLITEAASAGDFVGMAVSIPVTNVLTLLAFAAYLIWINWMLALVSLSIYPMVMLAVPWLQKKVNKANKRRVDATRDLASCIGEAVSGIHEIHGNGSQALENNRHGKLVSRLYRIRVRWNLYRFGVKAVNNVFTSLGPFLIFALGGWLTIHGQLQLGALVAFLSAQEKLYDPWKELMDFYQGYQEASVTYKRTMEYFDQEPEHALVPPDRAPYSLAGSLEVKNLSHVTPGGIALLEDISFSLAPGEHLALVGFSGSGKSTLALCVAQLAPYTSGSVLLGGREVSELTRQDMTQTIGFVSQSPFIFSGTVRENLLYARAAMESLENTSADADMPSLDDMIAVLQQTGLFLDVLRFGLNTVIDPEEHPGLARRLVGTRKVFRETFEEELQGLVEFYDPKTYLRHSSIAENLLFGSLQDPAFALDSLAANPWFLAFLDEADLTRPVISLGARLAIQMCDILGGLPRDSVFFEQSPLTPDEFPAFEAVAGRVRGVPLHLLAPEDQEKLLALGLRFAPGLHKTAGLPAFLENLVLEGRALFMDKIVKNKPGAVRFYEKETYITGQTIWNNILFGRSTTANPAHIEKISQHIIALLVEEDFLEKIVETGMEFEVGSKGDRLSGGQKQKLAVARTLLKDPTVLILDEATSALDNRSQARVQNLLETRLKGKTTVIAVMHRLDFLQSYDMCAVMKAGKIVEIGPPGELIARKGALHELLHGRK